jgi:hypothetical protein
MSSNSRMRARAKAHMPMVLLTLLSIIQALALELTWAHVNENERLFEATFHALLSWAQIITTLLGILLIWLLYSSMVMRFRWVPSSGDSTLPFMIGLIEFTLIASLGPATLAWWFVALAALFAITHWAIQLIMRRARLDGENDDFFAHVPRATLRDFYPTIAITAVLAGMGLLLGLSGHQGLLALLAVLGAAGAIGYQLFLNDRFWKRSMAPTGG